MKKIITSCLLVFVTTFTYAQVNIEAGLKGTLNIVSPVGLTDFPDKVNTKFSPGFGLGAYGQFGLLGFFVRPELMYSYETFSLDYSDLPNAPYDEFGVTANFIKIPVLIGKSFMDNKLGVYTGINLSFKASEEISFSGGDVTIDTDDTEDQLKGSRYGIPLGLYVGLGPIKVDARYNIGLSELADNDDDSSNFKSGVIEVSLLYKLIGI